jgi:hypothetical protein
MLLYDIVILFSFFCHFVDMGITRQGIFFKSVAI